MQKEKSKIVAQFAHTSIRIPVSLRKIVDKEALRNRRNLGQEIIYALESYYCGLQK